MFLIDPRAALLAVVFIVILYFAAARSTRRAAFGDARRGFLFQTLARNLFQLRFLPLHPKNWRPIMLVLSGNPDSRLTLLRYALWMEAGRGLVTVAQIIQGSLEEQAQRRQGALDVLNAFIRDHDIAVLPEVVVTPSFDDGVRVLLQAHSLAPIKPNVVVMGWPRQPERFAPFVSHLRAVHLLRKSAVIVVDSGLPPPDAPRRIDLWWRGKENGSLMLILAHLLTTNWEWKRAAIRILRQVPGEEAREPARADLEQIVHAARIEAEVSIIVSRDRFAEVLPRHSRNATVVFLGLPPPAEGENERFLLPYNDLLQNMPTAILVASSGEADLLA